MKITLLRVSKFLYDMFIDCEKFNVFEVFVMI